MLHKKHLLLTLLILASPLLARTTAHAFPSTHPTQHNQFLSITPHKAIYDIALSKISKGSQILNIDGEMYFKLESDCGGWITNHLFSLLYDYQDNSPIKMTSNMSSYESYDGKEFLFLASRKRNGELYEEIKGNISTQKEQTQVMFSKPETAQQTLTQNTLLPIQHTYALLEHAQKGTKYVNLSLFDGSDAEGAKDVSAFISTVENSPYHIKNNGILYKIDLAFFTQNSKNEQAEYEMTIYLHKSGIIPFMLINYGSFTMTQSLKTIEALPTTLCQQN